jgi:hypothetical protein
VVQILTKAVTVISWMACVGLALFPFLGKVLERPIQVYPLFHQAPIPSTHSEVSSDVKNSVFGRGDAIEVTIQGSFPAAMTFIERYSVAYCLSAHGIAVYHLSRPRSSPEETAFYYRADIIPSQNALVPASVALLLAWRWGYKRTVVMIRRRRGLCEGCGYDLRGVVRDVCSECGRPISNDWQ